MFVSGTCVSFLKLLVKETVIMETTLVVGDSKLDNDEMGVLFRRVSEIAKRIDSGSISKNKAMEALQAIVEGRAEKMLTPCKRKHLSSHQSFERPSQKERKRSKAPVEMRLPEYLRRLGIYDRFRELHPDQTYPEKHPEDIMAEMWEAENIPKSWLNHGSVPVLYILDESNPSVRDREVMASTLQWLGTNSGKEFLSRFVSAADLQM
ncbi:MAG: hypothetical protein ACI9H6_000879 [Patiriisocius sp.]|jgi:hypothetical protein